MHPPPMRACRPRQVKDAHGGRAARPVGRPRVSPPPLIPANAGTQVFRSFERQVIEQVPPSWIEPFDQLDFPEPAPLLHRPLAAERAFACFEGFVVDEVLHAVFGGEALNAALTVFPSPTADAVGMADVEGSVPLAGKDVDVESHQPKKPGSPRSRG